jgi:hypothetical protein
LALLDSELGVVDTSDSRTVLVVHGASGWSQLTCEQRHSERALLVFNPQYLIMNSDCLCIHIVFNHQGINPFSSERRHILHGRAPVSHKPAFQDAAERHKYCSLINNMPQGRLSRYNLSISGPARDVIDPNWYPTGLCAHRPYQHWLFDSRLCLESDRE